MVWPDTQEGVRLLGCRPPSLPVAVLPWLWCPYALGVSGPQGAREESSLGPLHARRWLRSLVDCRPRGHAAWYVMPRRSPLVLIFFSAMSACIAGRMDAVSVPSAAAICSPR